MDRIQQAKELLRHPLIVEFFEKGREAIYNSWVSSKDVEEREKIFLYKEAFDSFEEFFKRIIEEGEAKIEIDEQKKKRFGIF